MSIAEKLQTIAENEQRVYDAGKQAEYDKFWDIFQNYGEPTNYYYGLAYGKFTDENYNPKYPINCIPNATTSSMDIFYNAPITDTKVAIYAGGSIQAAFYGCKQLKTIRKIVLNKDTNISTAFYQTTALEDITIEGEIGKTCEMGGCISLTKKSITHLISVLSDGQPNTITLSKTAVNNAFETAQGLANGSTSEEWLALVNSKPNWTITLS